MRTLRAAARETAVNHYDLKRALLPRWERLFRDLIARRKPAALETPVEKLPARAIARVNQRKNAGLRRSLRP
jgi:hypothetical protein